MAYPSSKVLYDLGRVLLGVLLTAMGAGKITHALIIGHTSLFWIKADTADHPILFMTIVVLLAAILATGLSYIWIGISGFRSRNADPSPS
jgi:hypothetical protein